MTRTYRIFKNKFLLKNITAVYEEKISKKATRGIDKIGIVKFNEIKREPIHIIFKKCNAGNYKFSPYVEKLQNKGRNKFPRLISVSTIRDRIVLYIIKEILHEIFPECVYRKLPNNYIKEIKSFYRDPISNNICHFKTDINSFYDNIDHKILIDILKSRIKSKRLIHLISTAIKTPTVPANYRKKDIKEYKRDSGVPQGLSISNVLANIYLTNVDKILQEKSIKYIRYVDDILMFIDSENSLSIEDEVKEILSFYKLKLNKNKTECHISESDLEYLGYTISKSKVSVKNSNIERFITSVAAKFAVYTHNNDQQIKKFPWINKKIQKQVFIEDLNEKITGSISDNKRYGWLFYYVEISDIPLLHKLDVIISTFFWRLNDFNNASPPDLKKLAKSFYKIKYDSHNSYIHNYNKYESIVDKINYLGNRGYINPEKDYTKDEIEIIFNRIKKKRLTDLELDIGNIS